MFTTTNIPPPIYEKENFRVDFPSESEIAFPAFLSSRFLPFPRQNEKKSINRINIS
jgi:hypothetical protein